MNKALNWFRRGALIVGIVVGIAAVANGQVEGNLTEFGGTPLAGATVEIWDTYPGGSILASGTTDGSGDFSIPSVGVSSFDLRAHHAAYYPSVVRGLPYPIGNVGVALTPVLAPAALVTPSTASFWGASSEFLGALLKLGDIIEGVDPQGTHCSTYNIPPENGGYLLYVVGDDPGSALDEGAVSGDDIAFSINGLPATPSATWSWGTSTQNELASTPDVPGVTTVGPPIMSGTKGNPLLIAHKVKNTGATAETISLSVSVDLGWTVTIVTPNPIGPLAPGDSAQVDVLVEIPSDAGVDPATLTFAAVSGTYESANSGSFTTIDVTTTGVGDNGGNSGLIPNQFSLAQNFPNPFNPETQIAYNLRTDGHLRIEVFNIVGQSVTVLLDGYRPAGTGVVIWDGNDKNGLNVPSGIYFYRMSQNSLSQTRKMVLLK